MRCDRQALVERGAECGVADVHGETAVRTARKRGANECIALLEVGRSPLPGASFVGRQWI
jgi:hypothetical protein